MAIQPVQNDSILSVGLDIAETTEQSVGEIAASIDQQATELAGPEVEQNTREQDAALLEAQELAAEARAHEEAERMQELELSHELERDELER